MKFLILAAGIFTSGIAFARPSTLAMSCNQASALVKAKGAVVLNTSADTYDRFVAHAGYCLLGEEAIPAWVPTKDQTQCFVGYVCGQDVND